MTSTNSDFTVPVGMIVVTKEEFFTALYTDKRDIMPNNDNQTFTVWRDRDRKVFGRTLPGWKNPGDKRVYMLTQVAK